MATDFVTCCIDFPNQTRKSVGYPTKHKESSIDTLAGKQLEYARNISLDSRGIRIPLVIVNVRSEGFDLEIVFYVNTKNVQHTSGHN